MRLQRKLSGAWFIVAAIVAAAGCGSKDGNPAAAINGPALGNPQGNDAALVQANTKPARPEFNRKHPKVLIDTTLGPITLELDAEKAPITVDNFLTYADQGHYDQTIFHQVIKDYVVLGGSYTERLVEKKAHTPIRNEAHKALKNRRGTIAMARRPDAIDSATCQFFVNLKDNPLLDHKDRTAQGYGYCAFGQVTAGEEVLDKIASVEVHNAPQFEQVPTQAILIRSIRRIP